MKYVILSLLILIACTTRTSGGQFKPNRDYDVYMIGKVDKFSAWAFFKLLQSKVDRIESLERQEMELRLDSTVDKTIRVEINSGGGRVDYGFRIISFMEELKIKGFKFSCTVTGIAMSMAFTILQACDQRSATIGAKFMQHRAYPYSWYASEIDKIRFFYELKRINVTLVEYLSKYIYPERYFGSREAYRIGAIDYIYDHTWVIR